MKLYNLDNSPFAARVRIQIRHKKLPIAIVEPPIPLRTEEFRDTFPLQKLPILELENGSSICESTVIMDYLESLYPNPALKPIDPLENAYNGIMVRYADNHLASALSPLFADFLSQAQINEGTAKKIQQLTNEIWKLERLLGQLPGHAQRDMQTGDICLSTHLFYALEMASWNGENELISATPAVKSWWKWIREVEAVSLTITEMEGAHKSFTKRLMESSS